MFVRMFVGVYAPMPVMVVRFEDVVEKHAEAEFLGIVKTVIEGLGRIRDLSQFRTACRETFLAQPQAFDHVVSLAKLLGVFVPFGCARSSSFTSRSVVSSAGQFFS